MKSLYDVLGVDSGASPEAIQKAYREKAKTAHPDAGGSTEDFHALDRAMDILGDPGKRAKYDATGDDSDPRPHDPYAEAMGIIAQYTQQILADERDPLQQDIVGAIVKTIEQELDGGGESLDGRPVAPGLRQQLKVLTRAVDRCAKISERLSGEKGPLFAQVLAAHAQLASEAADRKRSAIDVRERAIAIMRDVNFRWDDPWAEQRKAEEAMRQEMNRVMIEQPQFFHFQNYNPFAQG